MPANQAAQQVAPQDDHHHNDHAAHSHGTLKSYLTGFGLSVVLTAIPFWLVMSDVLGSHVATALTILLLGALQIVVHMVYFLHMDFNTEGGWSFTAMVFTLVVIVISMTGSVWVMYHLNTNMMPMHTAERLTAPAAAVGGALAAPTPQNEQLP